MHETLGVVPDDKFNAAQITFSRNNKNTKSGSESITLYNAEVREFKEVSFALHGAIDVLTPGKRSLSSIEVLLKNALLDALCGIVGQSDLTDFDSRLNKVKETLTTELTNPPGTYTVHVCVQGLESLKHNFKFGEVTFCGSVNVTDDDIELLLNEKLGDDFFREEDRKASMDLYSKLYTKNLENNVIASVDVECYDSDAAHAAAKSTVQDTIDIINFFISLISPSTKSFLYLPGQAGNDRAQDFIFRWKQHLQIQSSSDYLLSFNLMLLKGSKIEGVDEVSAMLAKFERTEFEEVILKAIALCGKAVSSVRRIDKFLYYIIAIEATLKKRKERNIVDKLSHRFKELWFGSEEYSTIDSEVIKEAINTAYDIRCDIAHEGKYEFSDTHLSEARRYATSMIYQLLFDSRFENVETKSEFIEVLEGVSK
jgi:hypothetical protein